MASAPVVTAQYPTSPLAGGTFYNTSGLFGGHIFNQGMEQPDVLRAVMMKFPDFFLTSLLDKIGATGEMDNDTLGWSIMDNTRKSATATTVTNNTTATATAVLDTTYVAANGNLGYWLVGDTFRVANSGAIGIVTAVTNSSAVQQIDVQRLNGAVWTAADFASGHLIGHIGSAYGEGSTGAGGYRNYFPDNDYNVSTILRRDFKITRNAMTQKKWLDAPGGKDWWYAQEDFEQRNIMRDIEATILLGKRYKATNLGGANMSRGLLEYAEGSGVQQTFSSAVGVQEADISELLTQLSDRQGASELIALCGTRILTDLQHALGDRYRTIPNSSEPAKKAGLAFDSYSIAGKTLHLAKYEAFSDTSIFPAVTASSTVKDFRNLALVLDFSETENGKNIQVKYRKGAKMIQQLLPGMVGAGQAVNKFDGIEGAILTEFMPVVYMPNRLGLLFANS